jgi:hypothetical protein
MSRLKNVAIVKSATLRMHKVPMLLLGSMGYLAIWLFGCHKRHSLECHCETPISSMLVDIYATSMHLHH